MGLSPNRAPELQLFDSAGVENVAAGRSVDIRGPRALRNRQVCPQRASCDLVTRPGRNRGVGVPQLRRTERIRYLGSGISVD